jgi:hypothetical protein
VTVFAFTGIDGIGTGLVLGIIVEVDVTQVHITGGRGLVEDDPVYAVPVIDIPRCLGSEAVTALPPSASLM